MLLEEIGDIDDMVKEVLRDLERLDEGRKLSNPRYRDLTPGQARRVAFTRLADAKRKIDERERAIQRMGCFTFSFGDARYAKDRLSRDFLVYPGTGRPSGSEVSDPCHPDVVHNNLKVGLALINLVSQPSRTPPGTLGKLKSTSSSEFSFHALV